MSRRARPPWPLSAAAHRRERGSASIWVLGLSAVLVLAVVAAVLVGSAITLRHRAAAAADLAALAAAGRALDGQAAACAAATQVAVGMKARVDACTLTGLVAEVWVTAAADLGLVGRVGAQAAARAGPVSEWVGTGGD
ncbi:MAG: hypothetical protein H0T66_19390 [Geodermatophilaceae bacterium]|nr:hypothetical protein [Geodermatophilaceae bacterium]